MHVLNTAFTILQTTKRPLICGLLLFCQLLIAICSFYLFNISSMKAAYLSASSATGTNAGAGSSTGLTISSMKSLSISMYSQAFIFLSSLAASPEWCLLKSFFFFLLYLLVLGDFASLGPSVCYLCIKCFLTPSRLALGYFLNLSFSFDYRIPNQKVMSTVFCEK